MTQRTLGLVALALSTVLWAGVFVVPLVEAPPRTKWLAGAGLYGASYVFFFAAIWLVGREGMDALKARVKSWLGR